METRYEGSASKPVKGIEGLQLKISSGVSRQKKFGERNLSIQNHEDKGSSFRNNNNTSRNLNVSTIDYRNNSEMQQHPMQSNRHSYISVDS